MKSLGANITEKSHIKEIIEKHTTGDNEIILRDILLAIKELNLEKQKNTEFKPILNDLDDNNKHDLLELKINIKDL